MGHNYAAGRRLEYKVKKEWEAKGYICFRTAGSHGPADIIAASKTRPEVVFIQCKRVGGPKDAERVIARFKKEPFLNAALHSQVVEIYVKKTRERLTSWI